MSIEPLEMLTETQKLFYNSKENKFSLQKSQFSKKRLSASGERKYISRNILGNENEFRKSFYNEKVKVYKELSSQK